MMLRRPSATDDLEDYAAAAAAKLGTVDRSYFSGNTVIHEGVMKLT